MTELLDGNKLRNDARTCLEQAVDYCWGCQQSDGHWVAPVSADATFTAQYVMFKYQMPGLSLAEDGEAIKRWLLFDQTSDGSWTLAPGLPGNLSTTVEAYLALRILGISKSDPRMQKARDFVMSKGGVARVRFFTRFFLATFGLFPWKAIPQMPAELILLPTWCFLNIYVLSSWARSTLIPVLVARHHEPVYGLPNGRSPNNDFLDELWCDPTDKRIPFALPLWDLLWGPKRDIITLLFTIADKLIALLGGLRRWPLRRYAINQCIKWLLEHQEESGDWAGFFPPIHGSIWALLLEGYSMDSKEVHLGLQALERLAIADQNGKWLQSTVSPQWDTALMLNALCDAGYRDDPRLVNAANWLRDMQLMVSHGDWRIYANTQQAGGWSFEYYNTFYPDVDDAAVVVMTLVKQDPSCVNSECISNALEWILGMQGHDGGWGAFDINNDARWLHKIPFSDMDSLVDPSTSDVTGRMLECFGLLLAHREHSRLSPQMRRRLRASSKLALAFLQKEQESSGAAAGSWWGRWGNNYNYGTANVIRGLVWFARTDCIAYECSMRAIHWFENCQNEDGGWGETLLCYVDPTLAGCGESNAAQTAWALDCLLRFRPPTDPACQKGVKWLISNLDQKPEHGKGAHWRYDHAFVGTGFPNVLYLGYPFYHHHFPMQALARYINSSKHHEAETAKQGIRLSRHIATDLHRPHILLMAMGSRGDIEVFLNIAQKLRGCRVRIATHPTHQTVVREHGFEFYDITGSPDEFARVLGDQPKVLHSIIKGDFTALLRSINVMYQKLLESSIDDTCVTNATALDRIDMTSKLRTRPFLADVIVSNPATTAYIHAAERLQSRLVIVSPQPSLPTNEFPHYLTLTKPDFSPGRWWNRLSYFCLDLVNWLAFGSFINHLRVDVYRMRPLSWIWATRDFLQVKVPYVCLWSSHVVRTPSDWNQHVILGGYSCLDNGESYKPLESLVKFLKTEKPVIALSLGSANVSDPVKFLSMISLAIGKPSMRLVICRSWPAILEAELNVPDDIYIADFIPHSWLLPQVSGFVHHGGAGHTAAGIRAGIPMLAIPHFLDQYFWAAKMTDLGLGPSALDLHSLSSLTLAKGFKHLLSGRYNDNCKKLAMRVRSEGDGAKVAAEVIMGQMASPEMSASCSVFSDLTAHWMHKESGLLLSSAAVVSLISGEILGHDDIKLLPRADWASRWQNVQSSFGLVFMLRQITEVFSVIIHTLNAFTLWLTGSYDSVKESTQNFATQDPVRLVRMDQGYFDLQTIKESMDEKEAALLEERIVSRWHALIASNFHRLFSDDTTLVAKRGKIM